MAYFERIGSSRFRASEHTTGAWAVDEQHIGPALGLLVHAIEQHRDTRRDDGLVIARLSYDILGVIPVDAITVSVRVVRPGRTIELVEATLTHDGRAAVLLRAWLMAGGDTTQIAGTSFAPIPPRSTMPQWDPTSLWRGGYLASAHAHREDRGLGRAAYWVRSKVTLIRDELVSPLASAAALIDIANGFAVRASPGDVAFPNIDLTAHFFAQPHGEWLGFDTTVSFGADGIGLTHSVLHDEGGPIGAISQILTVRPR